MHRVVTLPLSSAGLWCHSQQGCVPCPCRLCLGILLSLSCVWAPGLAVGLVRHEAEEQGRVFMLEQWQPHFLPVHPPPHCSSWGWQGQRGDTCPADPGPGTTVALGTGRRGDSQTVTQSRMQLQQLFQPLEEPVLLPVNSLHNPFSPCFHQN